MKTEEFKPIVITVLDLQISITSEGRNTTKNIRVQTMDEQLR